MKTMNSAFGRRFVETVFVPVVDAKGQPTGAFNRVPAIWKEDGCTKPLESRQYYPGDDTLGESGRALVVHMVREKHQQELRKALRNKR